MTCKINIYATRLHGLFLGRGRSRQMHSSPPVLHHFFNGISGSLDHLSCSNPVHHRFFQPANDSRIGHGPPLTAGNTKTQMFSLPPPKYVRALSLLFACDQAWRTQSPERGTEEPLLCSHLQQELQEVEAVGHLQACKQRSGAPRCLSPGLSHSFHMQRAIANDLLLVAVPSRLQHTRKKSAPPQPGTTIPRSLVGSCQRKCVCVMMVVELTLIICLQCEYWIR